MLAIIKHAEDTIFFFQQHYSSAHSTYPTDIADFRPVSNLTFMSKVIERAATSQLNTYLSANGLMPRHQSAYRKKHSTETAMFLHYYAALTKILAATSHRAVLHHRRSTGFRSGTITLHCLRLSHRKHRPPIQY